MNNFKKGDRVIVSGEHGIPPNVLGVIEDVGGRIVTGVRLDNGMYIAANIKNVKHYNEDSAVVKVGDRVKVVGYKWLSPEYDEEGTEGVIVIINNFYGAVMKTDSGFMRGGHITDFEVIPTTPPQKIQQDGYEYELVGPVKPDWLVDGAWVVRKDNGCKHQVVLNKNGLLVLTMPGTDYSILPTRNIYDQYRPHTPEDFKWGDWAMYEGKRVFVMGRLNEDKYIEISKPPIHNKALDGWDYIYANKLTPTF